MPELAPAILTNDINDFRKQFAQLLPLTQYYSKLHIDFADGEFVKMKTLMPAEINFFRSSKVTAMAHLMVYNPALFFEDVKAAGFSYVLFHYEVFTSDEDIQAAINEAEKLDLIPGLVINPETPLTKIAKFIYRFKVFQIMTIHPGAQGRELIPSTLDKVKELRSLTKSVTICVDGGMKVQHIKKAVEAGADIIVVGAAISHSEDPQMSLMSLHLSLSLAQS